MTEHNKVIKNKETDWKEFFTNPGKFINEDALKKIAGDKELLRIVNRIK